MELLRDQRRAPLVSAAGLVAAAAVVAVVDPAGGLPLLPCPLHTVTGLWCPVCGTTRAVHALAHGRVLDALSSNLLLPLTLGAVATSWWRWFAASRGRPVRAVPRRATIAVAAVALVFAVIRNLPAGQPLAP